MDEYKTHSMKKPKNFDDFLFGFDFTPSQKVKKTEIVAYSLLNAIGDIGGLIDGIMLIFGPLTGLIVPKFLLSSILSLSYQVAKPTKSQRSNK